MNKLGKGIAITLSGALLVGGGVAAGSYVSAKENLELSTQIEELKAELENSTIGYTEEELQAAKDEAYEEGVSDGKDFEYVSQGLDLSSLGLSNVKLLNVAENKNLLFSQDQANAGVYLIDTNSKVLKKVYDQNITNFTVKEVTENFSLIFSEDTREMFAFNFGEETLTKVYENIDVLNVLSNTEDEILMSSTSEINPGIFVFSYETGTLSKIHETGYNWSKAYTYSNGNCFLRSADTSDANIYFVDLENNEVTALAGVNKLSIKFQEIANNDCLISSTSASNQGIWFFDYSDKTLEKVYDYGYQWSFTPATENGFAYVLSKRQAYDLTDYEKGIFKFDPTTGEMSQIVTTGCNWTHTILPDGNILFYSISTNYSSGGMYLQTASELKQIFESGDWDKYQVTEDKIYFYSKTTATCTGLYRYDSETETMIQVYDQGYSFNYWYELSDGNYIVSTYYVDSVLYFDVNNETLTQISTDLDRNLELFELSSGDCLISCYQSSSVKGLYLFSKANKTLTQVFDEGYRFDSFAQLKNGDVLINSNYLAGVLLFDHTTNTVTRIHSTDYDWSNCVEMENGDLVIISASSRSSGSYGILFYDYSEKSANIYSSGKFTLHNNQDGTCDWVGDNGEVYTYDKITEKLILKKLI